MLYIFGSLARIPIYRRYEFNKIDW